MRLLAVAGLAGFVLIGACNGGPTTPTPTPSPTIAPTATPASTPSPSAHGSSELSPVAFDPARALAHVEALALEIGPRPAGSDGEDKAARYLRDQLQGFGASGG